MSSDANRLVKFSAAVDEATVQVLESNSKAFVMGLGVDDPKGAFGTTLTAFKKFGSERVFDMPMSESAMTGVGVGAALNGHFPIMVHLRIEFLLLGIDQLINHAAKWKYMFGGKKSTPLLVRCVVGRGWGQAAQHSQSLHSLFAHVPGLRVVLPSNAYDAKGMIIAASKGDSPVLMVEHRWLHDKATHVPSEPYEVSLDGARVMREGKDVTIVAISHQVLEASTAAVELEKEGISAEVIDLRSIKPLDEETILKSLKKTGRLIAVDTSHKSYGVTSEVAALAAEKGLSHLKAPVQRVCLPEAPTPCSPNLEKLYYPGSPEIVAAVRAALRGEIQGGRRQWDTSIAIQPVPFVGPF